MQNQYPDQLHILQRKGKNGLGTAYIAGFHWALERVYQYICEMDCDFSHNPNDLIRLYTACAVDGNDMAIGSRYVGGLVNVINWPIGRVMMSYFASRYVKGITGLPIDTSSSSGKLIFHIFGALAEFEKGLITQTDGGYLTTLGKEAVEKLQDLLVILK